MPPLTSSQSVTSLSHVFTISRTSRTSRTNLNNFNTINSIRPTTTTMMSTTSRQQRQQQQRQQQQQQQPHHHHHRINTRLQAQLALFKSSIIPQSSTNLQINLIEPTLYFRGDSEESVGCFLRGNLILNLPKPTKIRKIEMKFVGKVKTYWPEGRAYSGSGPNRNDLCEEKEIMTHKWSFLSSSTSSSEISPLNSGSNSNRFRILRRSSSTSKFNLIPAGTHKYPFELFIPGNNPETIDTDRGTVYYKLSATAVRSGLLPNLHVSQTVPIIRTVLEERNSEGIAIASEWNNQLAYEITIPKRAYPIGDTIDIDLKLSPKTKKINIAGIKIQIEEESVYKSKGQKSIESRTLSVHKLNNFAEQIIISGKNDNDIITQEGSSSSAQIQDEENNSSYHKNISLPIPKCTSPIYFSYKSASINISHHLKFIYTIKSENNDNGKKKKRKFDIKVDVPVTILSCRCAEDLPQYEDDSPSYESPPSYEQSTSDRRRQSQRHSILNSINNEIRHNSTNTITTVATILNTMNESHHPQLERLLTF